MLKFKELFLYSVCFLTLPFLFESCQKTESSTTTTVTAVPFPPTDLTATVISTTQVNLSWVDKSTNEVGFNLERKTPATQFILVNNLGSNITNYNDKGLIPNITYTYRVYSYNSVGASPTYSNEVTVTTIGLPTLTTTDVSNFTSVNGASGGNITNDGGSTITARGIVWSTSQSPTITLGTKTTDGNGTGTFTSALSGLSATTKYYVRAYATNAAGTAYGNEVSFLTNNIDLKNKLVAFYPFTGNAGDSSGNGNHGTVSGATLSTDRFGQSNKSYFFNGINTYIDISNNFFNNGWDEYTISLWFYPTSDVSTSGPGQTFLNTNPHRGLGAGYNYSGSKKIFFFNQINPNTTYWDIQNFSLNNIIQLRTWTNFIIVKKGLDFNFYINGSFSGTVSHTSAQLSYLSSMRIGAITCCNLEVFNGNLDDIRFYNRTLNQDEITYLSKN